MTYSPLLSQNTALRGNLRGLLNISAWLCKTVCSAHNKRCLGVNVLEKGRKKIFMELTLSALRWSPLIINTPVPQSFLSFGSISGLHRPVPRLALFWTSDSGTGLICASFAATKLQINHHGNKKHHPHTAVRAVPVELVTFSTQPHLSGSAGVRDRQLLRSIWLCSFSYGCSVFDLQALILKRFFSVVLQTYQKKKQRSLRPLDVTVNLKITSELSVSPYNEIAQWLALHNNVYSFSQAVCHFRDRLMSLKVVHQREKLFLHFTFQSFLPSQCLGKGNLKMSELSNQLFDLTTEGNTAGIAQNTQCSCDSLNHFKKFCLIRFIDH